MYLCIKQKSQQLNISVYCNIVKIPQKFKIQKRKEQETKVGEGEKVVEHRRKSKEMEKKIELKSFTREGTEEPQYSS